MKLARNAKISNKQSWEDKMLLKEVFVTTGTSKVVYGSWQFTNMNTTLNVPKYLAFIKSNYQKIKQP